MRLLTRHPTLRVLAALLTASLLALSLDTGADAQSVDDKRAEAEQVASELEQLRIRASQLDEEYAVALDELDQAQQDILAAQERVAELEQELSVNREAVAGYAVEAYIGGDAMPSPDTMLDSQMNEVGTRVAYIEVASGSKQDLLDELAAADARLAQELERLAEAEAEAQQLSEQADAARAGAQQAVADEEALLSRVEGELAELVAAEEARRAEETRQRAEAQAVQAADEAGQAPPPAAPAESDISDDAPTPAPAPPPVTGGPPGGASGVVSLAYSLLGIPYVWAGSSPSTGFDCSGFTSYVWGQNGYSLPHSAAAQHAMTIHVPVPELQPGDLVFYGYGYIHHVALYVGGGQIIHAPGSGRSVRIDSVYYWDQLLGSGRLP